MQDRYNEMAVFCRVVRLFQRTTRRLNLTDEGSMFFERSREILEDIDDAETQVAALQSNVTGTLDVTAISAFARTQLCQLMPAFMAQHPDLRVELSLTERQVDLIALPVTFAPTAHRPFMKQSKLV